ncbi:MAG: HEAT repeat domain-containing protein, partial [Chloroflexota bacterium]
ERHARLAMVRALGKIGDSRAVEVLIAALETPAWTPDYRRLVDDLAQLGGERAIDPLIRLVQSKTYTYGSAAQAARVLLNHRADPRVLDGFIAALRLDAEFSNVEFSTLQALIAGLAEIGDPRGAQSLLKWVSEMVALPAGRWDDHDENLSETDQGVVFHVLKTEYRDAVNAIRKIGDPATIAALDQIAAPISSALTGSDQLHTGN